MEKKKIKAIFFDIDDTLYATTRFTEQARYNAMKAMTQIGLRMEVEALFHELKEIIHEFSSNFGQHFDKLLLRIPAESYAGINKAILVAAAVVAYHDTKHTCFRPFPHVQEVMEYLLRFSCLKGVITDGLEIKQSEKLIRLGLYRYFSPQAIFISDQIGISKTNPKIYQYVCHRLKLSPHEMLYVGDHPERDIDCANYVGIHSIRMKESGSKYEMVNGKTKPCHEIRGFEEFIPLLEEHYELIGP